MILEMLKKIFRARFHHEKRAQRAYVALLRPVQKYFLSGNYHDDAPVRTANYASFSTATLIGAVTSRNTLMVTCCSPMILIGSASCTWRLSILNPCAASPSAMSAVVTEPNIWSFSPVLRVNFNATAFS